MMTELLKWGIGVIPVRMAERFVRESAAFLRNLTDPGSITTQAVYREEKKILSMIEAGQGTLAPIDSGNAWKIQSQKIAGDPGQANAVQTPVFGNLWVRATNRIRWKLLHWNCNYQRCIGIWRERNKTMSETIDPGAEKFSGRESTG
jgi:hypothetical protein